MVAHDHRTALSEAVCCDADVECSSLGALLLASLPVACAPAATPPSPPSPLPSAAPPAASASATPTISERDAEGFLYPFASVPEGEPPPVRGTTTPRPTEFGRGQFVLLQHSNGGLNSIRTMNSGGEEGGPFPPSCPFARASGCASYLLKVRSATAPAHWPGEASKPGPETTVGPLPAPHAWVDVAGGRDAVYALREGGTHVDRIDTQGKVTTVVSDPKIASESRLWVVELGARLYLAVARSSGPWRLGEVLDGPADQPRTLGPLTELPLLPRPATLYSAQDIRGAGDKDRRVSYGPPTLLPLPDEGGATDRWALAWLELVAPPPGWPHGEPQHKGKPRKKFVPVERDGCGSTSRSIDDLSVDKRAHLTVFSGARIASDKVVWSTGNLGEVATFSLGPRLERNAPVLNGPGAPHVTPTPPPEPPASDDDGILFQHREMYWDSAFDVASGEGVVIALDTSRLMARRFDASGAFVGAPVVLEGYFSPGGIVRAGDHWLALGLSPNQESPVLLDLRRNKPIELPPAKDARALVTTPQGPHLVARKGKTIVLTPIRDDGTLGAPLAEEPLPEGSAEGDFWAFSLQGSWHLGLSREADDITQGQTFFWRSAAPGSAWKQTKIPFAGDGFLSSLGFRPLLGDTVLERLSSSRSTYVWLKSGKIVESETSYGSVQALQPRPMVDGPLAGDGVWLPEESGPLTPIAALRGIEKNCHWSVQTGRDTAMAICLRSRHADVGELRIALRPVHR